VIVSVPGADLFYSTRGRGPACFVLSLIGTEPYNRLMPPALDEHVRLVFVDLRGCGQSTGDAAQFSLERSAEDLDAIRAALGVKDVIVLGHSILGAVALEYACRRAESVSHVITIATPPRGDMTWLQNESRSFFERDASDDRKAALRENLARLPAHPSLAERLLAQTPTRFFDPHADATIWYEGAVMKPGGLEGTMGALSGWDVRTVAGSLRAPILLAHGRYDYVVPYELGENAAALFPRATFQVFERSGHQPFFEEPGRFVEVVTSWLAAARAV
jgi:proline iminopeptidase